MSHHRLLALWMPTATTAGAQWMTPPVQPAERPGGAQRSHGAVTKHRYGSGNDQFTGATVRAVRDRAAPLQTEPGHVLPDTAKFATVVTLSGGC